MFKVKVYGAGSIGNHLSFACRNKGWDVTICDIDLKALERTKSDIYPARYGKWDSSIKLMGAEEKDNEKYDLVIIGTPPNSHGQLALEILKTSPPDIMLIEKPALTPDLKYAVELNDLAGKVGTKVFIGYNHTLTENTRRAEQLLEKGAIGKPLTITSMTREHWGGIFSAHPWLNGPEDTYLGYITKGGGACCEHSHAINIWQHFAHHLKFGKIHKVTATLNMVKEGNAEYDDLCFLNVITQNGIVGNIIQDVVTSPTQKNLRIQGSDGFLEWHVGYKTGVDAVIYSDCKENNEILIPKTRPDDFKGEIDHLEKFLTGETEGSSPISLERGLDTMMVVAAAYVSSKEKREVTIDYSEGYSLNAIK